MEALVKSVVAIENVYSAIDQIAQTTLRKVVGQHSLDQTLSETDKINLDIRKTPLAAIPPVLIPAANGTPANGTSANRPAGPS